MNRSAPFEPDQAVAGHLAEILQLRETIGMQREELERSVSQHELDAQNIISGHRNEVIQLHATLRALRDELEERQPLLAKFDFTFKVLWAKLLHLMRGSRIHARPWWSRNRFPDRAH